MIEAPGITVNGIKITPEQISAEVQYHPAGSLPEAKYQAMQALVIRELLLQKAMSLGMCSHEEALKNPDNIIESLLEREIAVQEPSAEECALYYKNNSSKFQTAPVCEASHIFYPAPVEDDEARRKAYDRAMASLERIRTKPSLFESIAHAESACSSAKSGGFLGQISKGQTVPAFEAALLAMKEGEVSQAPVATEVGYHIIRMHRKSEGKVLPLDVAMEWVADHLKKQRWNTTFRQYVQILAGEAKISGFHMKGADTPLVQ